MQLFSGKEYLLIDVASTFGLDKLDWADRIAWTEENESRLESLVPEAESPALFDASVRAWRKSQKGIATGYPISMDAAASGLQFLAVLTECEKSARHCGVVSTGHRADAYTSVYKALCARIGDSEKIARNQLKDALMTALYSSKAEPRKVFGEGELLNSFYATCEDELPGAWALNLALQTLWNPMAPSHDWILPDGFEAHVKEWKLATHMIQFRNAPAPVYVKVNEGAARGQSISPNLIHSVDGMVVREMTRRCSYDAEALVRVREALKAYVTSAAGSNQKRPQDRLLKRVLALGDASGFFSARVLDLVDSDNVGILEVNQKRNLEALVESLPKKPFPMLSIHDCFRVHPNKGNDLRRTYNQVLSEIARSDMMSFMASQVRGKHVPVTKRGSIADAILVADYALC